MFQGIRARFRLFLAAFSANLLYISTGAMQTWSSPVVPRLPEALQEAGGMIATAFLSGCILGPIIVSHLVDRIGRKFTLLVMGAMFLLAWVLIGASYNLYVILIGRVIGGVGVGASFIAVPIYLTEISDNEVREALGSMTEFFIGIGYLIEFTIGPFISYGLLAIVSSVPGLLFLCAFACMPESPMYLVNKGNHDKARDSLRWLRENPSEDVVEQEILQISQNIQASKELSQNRMDLLKPDKALRHFGISLLTVITSTCTGITIITTFTESIFEMAQMTVSNFVGTVSFGVANLVSTAFAPSVVQKFGLKSVYVTTTYIMSLCLLILAAYFFLQIKYDITSTFSGCSWIPIITLMVYNMSFCIGNAPLMWTTMAIVLPTNVKAFALSFCSTLTWFNGFIITISYAAVVNYIGPYYIFGTFGILLSICVTIIVFILPDLRGLSLQEVHELIGGKSVKSSKTDLKTESAVTTHPSVTQE